MALKTLLVGVALMTATIAVVATPASAHPCFLPNDTTFTCLEDRGDEVFVCTGTYSDDDNNGGYTHGEENTFACSNGIVPE